MFVMRTHERIKWIVCDYRRLRWLVVVHVFFPLVWFLVALDGGFSRGLGRLLGGLPSSVMFIGLGFVWIFVSGITVMTVARIADVTNRDLTKSNLFALLGLIPCVALIITLMTIAYVIDWCRRNEIDSYVLKLSLDEIDGKTVTPRCGACGYDLTGNQSGICPECGVSIPEWTTS